MSHRIPSIGSCSRHVLLRAVDLDRRAADAVTTARNDAVITHMHDCGEDWRIGIFFASSRTLELIPRLCVSGTLTGRYD